MAGAPLSLAISSPLWGLLADRIGRRIMMVRAYLAAGLVIFLMGTVDSVSGLLILRIAQGFLTGTLATTQTFVAAIVPSEKSGQALGNLNSGVFIGVMTGTALGGFFAHHFGYRASFLIAGLLPLIGAIVILLGTQEQFERPTRPARVNREGLRSVRNQILIIAPILLSLWYFSLARQFELPFVALLVQDIHGSIDGVSLWMGTIGAVAGLAGFLGSIFWGTFADKHTLFKGGCLAALGSALFLIPQGLAASFLLLYPARFGVIFCSAGLEPVFGAWLVRSTPEHKRGLIFGLANSARALGWGCAPLLGSLVAVGLGLRSIFFLASVLFLGLVPLIYFATRSRPNGNAH